MVDGFTVDQPKNVMAALWNVSGGREPSRKTRCPTPDFLAGWAEREEREQF